MNFDLWNFRTELINHIVKWPFVVIPKYLFKVKELLKELFSLWCLQVHDSIFQKKGKYLQTQNFFCWIEPYLLVDRYINTFFNTCWVSVIKRTQIKCLLKIFQSFYIFFYSFNKKCVFVSDLWAKRTNFCDNNNSAVLQHSTN